MRQCATLLAHAAVAATRECGRDACWPGGAAGSGTDDGPRTWARVASDARHTRQPSVVVVVVVVVAVVLGHHLLLCGCCCRCGGRDRRLVAAVSCITAHATRTACGHATAPVAAHTTATWERRCRRRTRQRRGGAGSSR